MGRGGNGFVPQATRQAGPEINERSAASAAVDIGGIVTRRSLVPGQRWIAGRKNRSLQDGGGFAANFSQFAADGGGGKIEPAGDPPFGKALVMQGGDPPGFGGQDYCRGPLPLLQPLG